MNWTIESISTNLFISDNAGNSVYYPKATLSCYASNGNIIIKDSVLGIIFNQNPADISIPTNKAVNDLVKQIKAYL
jgi:hypothetical protein